MPRSPSIVPHGVNHDIYLVLNDFGKQGRAWCETDEQGTDRETPIRRLQKYEAGKTRISASRRYSIAVQLAVPITWFFDELEVKKRASVESKQTSEAQEWSELVTKRESRQLLELYFGITDERLRRKLMEVAQLLKTTDME